MAMTNFEIPFGLWLLDLLALLRASMGPLFGYLSEHFIGLSMTYWLSASLLLLLSITWFMKGNVGMRRNSIVYQ
jgi:hypothetical protein